MPFTDQSAFDIRCEWGTDGVAALAGCRTFIVIDVLSFSTCVSVAASRNVAVFPYHYKDESAIAFAAAHDAVLAGKRGELYSLSPASLLNAPAGMRVVLPSPNGATICLEAGHRGHVLAGCFRNRRAVCERAMVLGGPFALIPAGERWSEGTLRPSWEDLAGAGAIAALLPGTRSPETAAVIAVFESASSSLADTLRACSSGRELIEWGFADDVRLAGELDVDRHSPLLINGVFR
ncbi:MAG: 2-phosphosulfolactate phosphatase [Planctomycetaceae bacterium]